MHPNEVRQRSVTGLMIACGTETSRFVNRQPTSDAFAYELFRRAICERDERAWEAIFTQYGGLVRAWLVRHPTWTAVGDDGDDWTYRAFERFWSAVTSDRFAAFPSVAALLRYLKLCTHSVLLDECRKRHMWRCEPLGDERLIADEQDPERTVVGTVAGEKLWAVIAAEVKDEAERLVVTLCLTLEMKPQAVYARHPEQFASVGEVYTAKRNLLDRLRRNPAIREYLQ